jgi:hypothetical protein
VSDYSPRSGEAGSTTSTSAESVPVPLTPSVTPWTALSCSRVSQARPAAQSMLVTRAALALPIDEVHPPRASRLRTGRRRTTMDDNEHDRVTALRSHSTRRSRCLSGAGSYWSSTSMRRRRRSRGSGCLSRSFASSSSSTDLAPPPATQAAVLPLEQQPPDDKLHRTGRDLAGELFPRGSGR